MAKLVELRVSDGTNFNGGLIYPKTIVGQIVDLLDSSGKVRLNLLSGALFGGAKNIGALTTNIEASDVFAKILENAVSLNVVAKPGIIAPYSAHEDLKNTLVGRYFQIQNSANGYITLALSSLSNAVATTKNEFIAFYNANNFPFSYTFKFDGDDGSTPTSPDLTLENGDFLVFNNLEFGSPSIKHSEIALLTSGYNYDMPNIQLEFVNGYQGQYQFTINYSNPRYVDQNARRIRFDYVSVIIQGLESGGHPTGDVICLKVGDLQIAPDEYANILVGNGTLETIFPGNAPAYWDLRHTFLDFELTFTETEWAKIYDTTVSNDNVVVHFGVVNNTYNDSTETLKGVIKTATLAEANAGVDNFVAMTPLRTKNAIDTFGLKVSGIPSANETVKGLVELANSSEVINTVLSPTLIPSVIRVKEMIDHFGKVDRFATLAEANASPSAGVVGKMVIIG